jgi:hypothetical protein
MFDNSWSKSYFIITTTIFYIKTKIKVPSTAHSTPPATFFNCPFCLLDELLPDATADEELAEAEEVEVLWLMWLICLSVAVGVGVAVSVIKDDKAPP